MCAAGHVVVDDDDVAIFCFARCILRLTYKTVITAVADVTRQLQFLKYSYNTGGPVGRIIFLIWAWYIIALFILMQHFTFTGIRTYGDSNEIVLEAVIDHLAIQHILASYIRPATAL